MALTTGGRGTRQPGAARGATAGTARPRPRTAQPARGAQKGSASGAARPARAPAAPVRTTAARRPRSASDDPAWLGQWNSSVTSYYLLVGASTLLLVIGLVMVLSSSAVEAIAAGESPYGPFLDQAQFALLGLPVMLVATRLPVQLYKRVAWPALGIVSVLLVAVIFVGSAKGGNTAWLHVGPVNVQPSELAKLALAVWLGLVLGRKQALLHRWQHALVPGALGVGIVFALIMAGQDLGTGLIVGLLSVGAYFVAGVRGRLLAGAGALAAVLVVGVFVLGQSTGNRVDRILAVYDPDCDAQGLCYQVARGLSGLGTGGLWGVGLGAGREKWSYLPEAHNDFIFAVIGEELGLLGALLVLGLFAVLGVAMARVVRRHPDPFVKITTAAVATWIVGQALVNIGVVIGVLPVIGVPLPLVSAGGSALVTTMAALGMVISFSRTEPGASEALSARGSVVRRSLAVVGRSARRRGAR